MPRFAIRVDDASRAEVELRTDRVLRIDDGRALSAGPEAIPYLASIEVGAGFGDLDGARAALAGIEKGTRVVIIARRAVGAGSGLTT